MIRYDMIYMICDMMIQYDTIYDMILYDTIRRYDMICVMI